MILVSQKTRLNCQIAQKLNESNPNQAIFYSSPLLDFSEISDETLTIVDLNADGIFQDLLTPRLYAADLVNKIHLPESIKSINILVSDINYEHRLDIFCDHLEMCLSNLNREIKVNRLTSPRRNLTFIVPPTGNESTWDIYEIPVDTGKDLQLKFTHDYKAFSLLNYFGIEEKKLENFNKLKACSDKKLIWNGTDILSFELINRAFNDNENSSKTYQAS